MNNNFYDNIDKLKDAGKKIKDIITSRTDIFNSTDLLIVEADASTGHFSKVSKGWENTFQYTSDEFCSQPWLSYVHPDDIEPTMQVAENMSNGIPVKNFVNRYRRKDGSYVMLLWMGEPFKDDKKSYVIAVELM